MDINIKTIPHERQRYQTVGDWYWTDKGDLEVRVSDMGNPVYEWLVAEHEINEALMCKRDGVKENIVTDFDEEFEQLRIMYPYVIGDMEPGDMVSAPYHKQHKYASQIEGLSAAKHNINWEYYTKAVNDL